MHDHPKPAWHLPREREALKVPATAAEPPWSWQ